LGLISGSSKSESSWPIRGSTSEFVVLLRLLLVVISLVPAEGMLLISEALLIIKVSGLDRLNSEAGSLAASIRLSCSEFSDWPGVWYNKVLLVLISDRIECFVGTIPGIKDSSSSIRGFSLGSGKGTLGTPDFRVE